MAHRRPISLDDLPKWSPWPRRLLGLDEFAPRQRTVQYVEQEYNREKYARLLRFQEEDPRRTADDVREFETAPPGQAGDSEVCVSEGLRLFADTRASASQRFAKLLESEIERSAVDRPTVVELGGGYGYNLWVLSKTHPEWRFVNCDYSLNAVTLADRLYPHGGPIRARRFDFYDPKYELFDELAPGSTVVFTVHALSQLPTARPFVDAMSESRDKVGEVIHFEPLYDLDDSTTLLGLLRRRYADVNDYNRDLLSTLRARDDVLIMDVRQDVLGANPLTPLSIVRWRFTN